MSDFSTPTPHKEPHEQALELIRMFGDDALAMAQSRIVTFQQYDDTTMLRHWYLVAAHIKHLTLTKRPDGDGLH